MNSQQQQENITIRKHKTISTTQYRLTKNHHQKLMITTWKFRK